MAAASLNIASIPNNLQRVEALRNYVRNQPPPNKKRTERRDIDGELMDFVVDTKSISERIQEIVDHQEPLTAALTVYRGQKPPHSTITPQWWFSTSTSPKIARNSFSNSTHSCCTFTIHVQPGVKVLNVNNFLELYGGTHHEDEQEYIVNRGGRFYQDETRTITGFREDGSGKFTTFYFPTRPDDIPVEATVGMAMAPPSNANTNKIIEKIYNDEKNWTDSPEDLRTSIMLQYKSPSNAKRFSLEKVRAVFNRKKGTRRMRRRAGVRRRSRRV